MFHHASALAGSKDCRSFRADERIALPLLCACQQSMALGVWVWHILLRTFVAVKVHDQQKGTTSNFVNASDDTTIPPIFKFQLCLHSFARRVVYRRTARDAARG
jgi:hypothetical protein